MFKPLFPFLMVATMSLYGGENLLDVYLENNYHSEIIKKRIKQAFSFMGNWEIPVKEQHEEALFIWEFGDPWLSTWMITQEKTVNLALSQFYFSSKELMGSAIFSCFLSVIFLALEEEQNPFEDELAPGGLISNLGDKLSQLFCDPSNYPKKEPGGDYREESIQKWFSSLSRPSAEPNGKYRKESVKSGVYSF